MVNKVDCTGYKLESNNYSNDGYVNDENIETYPELKYTTCSRKVFQKVTVTAPVAVKPFALAGPTKTFCCGEPVLKDIRCHNYHSRCHGNRHYDQVCTFTFSQDICVEIPIHFGAKACVGESRIKCYEPFSHYDGDDTDCDDGSC